MVKTLLERHKPQRLIVFSRDELKQFQMEQKFPRSQYPAIRYFIGDVRDYDRLNEAFHEVDYVIHAAALKQVPAAEYNPFEAIKTNILGAQNVIRAAIQNNVKKIIALSTDKAANPVNLYGATKLCSDKLFIAGNSMSGERDIRFSVVRYGNVVASRGSVIPFFLDKEKEGVIPVTDERMTRFSITLQQGVEFVLNCFNQMVGGELFIPKIPSYRILDVVKAIAPNAEVKFIGIRPGEKLHEVMVPEDEAHMTLEFDTHFIIQPAFTWWTARQPEYYLQGRKCPVGFSYNSLNNPQWLSVSDLQKLISEIRNESPNHD